MTARPAGAFDCGVIEAHEIGTHSALIRRVVAPPLEALIFQQQQQAATMRVL